VKAKSRAVTHRTSQQDLAVVLIDLNQITRGWATASGTPAKHAFTRIDLAWWRVVRMPRTRHRQPKSLSRTSPRNL
jgi:RNA-directed DNA polymerase